MNQTFESDELGPLVPQLDAAVHATLREKIPLDAVERVKQRARQLALPETTLTTPTPASAPTILPAGRLRRAFGALTAVAVIAVTMLLAITWSFDRRSLAFADVLQQIRATEGVQFTMRTSFGGGNEQVSHVSMTNRQMRMEAFNGALIQIADFEQQRALFLSPQQKLAQQQPLNPQVISRFSNPITELRNLKLANAQRIGAEDLEGRRTEVFMLNEMSFMGLGPDLETKVWVDKESKLPVKIVAVDMDPKAVMKIQFENFVWNPDLKFELFSTEMPKGYSTGIIVRDVAPTPAPTTPASPEPQFKAGLISSDRVPGILCVSPDGANVTAILRDTEANMAAGRTQPHDLRQWDLKTGLVRWSERIAGSSSLAETRDGQHLATVVGFEIQLRASATSKIMRTWVTQNRVGTLAFSPDGQLLAAGIAAWAPGGKPLPGGIEIWNVAQGTLVRTIHDDKPTAWVRFSPNGSQLLSTSNDGPIKLWKTLNGQLERIFPGSLRADFSPDGTLLACPSTERSKDKNVTTINVYQTTDGNLVQTLKSAPAQTASYPLWVEFSPDGTHCVASDWNGTVAIWNVRTQTLLPTEFNHKAGVHVARWLPDGKSLVTSSEDQQLKKWDIPAAQ